MDEYLDQFMDDHLNGGYGDILDQLEAEARFAEEYPDLDEPWDHLFAQQELEDFEQTDEYFGYYGGDEDWRLRLRTPANQPQHFPRTNWRTQPDGMVPKVLSLPLRLRVGG